MDVGNFGLSKGLARSLERADISRVYDLVTRSPSALREPARFTPPELTELLIWLARFRLRLNMPHDGWLRAHLDELRTAFQEDIALVTAADAAEPESAVMDSLDLPTAAPLCLEDELEKTLSPGLRDKRPKHIRKFFRGVGRCPGATLEENRPNVRCYARAHTSGDRRIPPKAAWCRSDVSQEGDRVYCRWYSKLSGTRRSIAASEGWIPSGSHFERSPLSQQRGHSKFLCHGGLNRGPGGASS